MLQDNGFRWFTRMAHDQSSAESVKKVTPVRTDCSITFLVMHWTLLSLLFCSDWLTSFFSSLAAYSTCGFLVGSCAAFSPTWALQVSSWPRRPLCPPVPSRSRLQRQHRIEKNKLNMIPHILPSQVCLVTDYAAFDLATNSFLLASFLHSTHLTISPHHVHPSSFSPTKHILYFMSSTTPRRTGKVKFFNSQKGFGFIIPSESTETAPVDEGKSHTSHFASALLCFTPLGLHYFDAATVICRTYLRFNTLLARHKKCCIIYFSGFFPHLVHISGSLCPPHGDPERRRVQVFSRGGRGSSLLCTVLPTFSSFNLCTQQYQVSDEFGACRKKLIRLSLINYVLTFFSFPSLTFPTCAYTRL